jgi:putative membrane protein
MMYWGNHMSTGGWIFSILATLIFLALIVALILWLASSTSSSAGLRPGESRESPKEILDRRLASGELSVEQYQQLRDTLGTQGQPPPTPPTARGPQTPSPRSAGAASG